VRPPRIAAAYDCGAGDVCREVISFSGWAAIAGDLADREVLSAYVPVPPVGWLVFVERPTEEAYAPLDENTFRADEVIE
jgi:hypothetical protein